MHNASAIKLFLVSSLILISGLVSAQCVSQNSLFLAGSFAICPGGTANITVIGDFDDYLWDNGDTDSIFVTNLEGIYSLTVTDSLGCTLNTSIEVRESSELRLLIGGDNEVCNIDSTALYGGYGFQSYLWSTGETTPDIFAYQTGDYTLSVIDVNGCAGSTSFSLRMQLDTISPVFVTCPGQGIPTEIQNSGSDVCDGNSPLIESVTGYPFQPNWVEHNPNQTFPGVVTDDMNGGLPTLIEYRDDIIISSCMNSNVAFEFERTWRASDDCGNFDECTQIIRILDTSPPTIINGNNFFISQDAGNPNGPFTYTALYCPFNVVWNEPGINDILDNCTSSADLIISSSHTSGSDFSQGITGVSYVIEDECGNQNQYYFEIDVDCFGCNSSGTTFTNCSDPVAVCDINDIDNYSACTPEYQGQVIGPLCNGGALNNPSYLNFIAGASSINLTITPQYCTPGDNGTTGIQANITDPCNSSVCYATSGTDCFVTPFTFQATIL